MEKMFHPCPLLVLVLDTLPQKLHLHLPVGDGEAAAHMPPTLCSLSLKSDNLINSDFPINQMRTLAPVPIKHICIKIDRAKFA